MNAPVTTSSPKFSLAEARKIVKDLFRPNPIIYWADFFITWTLGMVCYLAAQGIPYASSPNFNITWPRVAFFFASCLLFYRMIMFTHEMVHLPHNKFKGFRFVWNALCGIPFLIPSFMYYTHNSHHRRSHYGTDEDGEYLPMSHRSPWYILFYLSWNLILPPLALLRFAILTPLTWFSPRLRNFVHRRLSSIVIDPSYIRPLPTKSTLKIIRFQEVCCFIWIIILVTVASIEEGGFPIYAAAHIYCTAVVVMTLNSIRTLGAHRYFSNGSEVTFEEQLNDSLNYPRRRWITELWGPLGLRYHALHHLFPTLPYHAMPTAHRRLMEQLPENSPYRRTIKTSLTETLVSLWRRAGKQMRDNQAPADFNKSNARQVATRKL